MEDPLADAMQLLHATATAHQLGGDGGAGLAMMDHLLWVVQKLEPQVRVVAVVAHASGVIVPGIAVHMAFNRWFVCKSCSWQLPYHANRNPSARVVCAADLIALLGWRAGCGMI